ncbi:MAG: hypothetical protein II942_04370 [Alphaproteobacteria bacterium]|nr:hypothetical protein [Alphaproteobacteria bacterium]
MADTPEELKDDLGAYPLRLHVNALPERRFFKMIRTLTVGLVLAASLLIVLGVFLNYQLTHQDVSVGNERSWQFYYIDPERLTLKQVQPARTSVPALQILVEEQLIKYLTLRNSTVWARDTMESNFSAGGPIARMSRGNVYSRFASEVPDIQRETRGRGLIRDVHIYDLQLVYPNENLWMAIIEKFDLPITDDLQSECQCNDNSKKCLQCKMKKAKKRTLSKIWLRTGFNQNKTLDNPLGISVDRYLETFMPIREDRVYWDLPAPLIPDI